MRLVIQFLIYNNFQKGTGKGSQLNFDLAYTECNYKESEIFLVNRKICDLFSENS